MENQKRKRVRRPAEKMAELVLEAERVGAAQVCRREGMPPLTRFTNQLTCSKISASGKLVPVKCKRSK